MKTYRNELADLTSAEITHIAEHFEVDYDELYEDEDACNVRVFSTINAYLVWMYEDEGNVSELIDALVRGDDAISLLDERCLLLDAGEVVFYF